MGGCAHACALDVASGAAYMALRVANLLSFLFVVHPDRRVCPASASALTTDLPSPLRRCCLPLLRPALGLLCSHCCGWLARVLRACSKLGERDMLRLGTRLTSGCLSLGSALAEAPAVSAASPGGMSAISCSQWSAASKQPSHANSTLCTVLGKSAGAGHKMHMLTSLLSAIGRSAQSCSTILRFGCQFVQACHGPAMRYRRMAVQVTGHCC